MLEQLLNPRSDRLAPRMVDIVLDQRLEGRELVVGRSEGNAIQRRAVLEPRMTGIVCRGVGGRTTRHRDSPRTRTDWNDGLVRFRPVTISRERFRRQKGLA